MWNNANYTEKCYTNIHILCISNCQLQLTPVFTIMQHTYNIQTEVTVWYNASQRPTKHSLCQDAYSVLIL